MYKLNELTLLFTLSKLDLKWLRYDKGTIFMGDLEVPMKFITIGDIFSMIHTMPQVDRASSIKESNFFRLELISCDKNGFSVT